MVKPYTCQNLCQKLLSTNKDKLATAIPGAPTNGGGTPIYTFAVLFILSIYALVPPFAFANLVAKYTDADLQRAIKLAFELFL